MKWAPDASTVKNALAAHAAIGLVAGALLYIVCLSGTFLVFYEEWQRIEQPHVPEMSALDPVSAQRALDAVLAREAGEPKSEYLYFQFPTEHLPRAAIGTDHQTVYVDAHGRIAGPKEIAWSDFLYALHYTLQIPGLWGITIVGGLGAMILALSLTGVIAHPRIFRDAFRLRARDGGGIALADWHNRLSVWTLPFAVAIAFTGAVIGLATVSANGIAARYYHGDDDLTYAPIFGGEPAINQAPAPTPDLAAALGYMRAHYPEVAVSYATIFAPRTAGQKIEIVGEHRHRLIFGEYYDFDGAGRFKRKVGLSDGDLGQQAAASNYNLHFGNYGGLPVKLAYFVFGLALTAIVATGTYIWLGKRRRRDHREPRLRAAWTGIVAGVPLALLATLVARPTIGNAAPFGAIFWLSLLALVAANVARASLSARSARSAVSADDEFLKSGPG
jgi:uncharacterized iron-regulated membrane protein